MGPIVWLWWRFLLSKMSFFVQNRRFEETHLDIWIFFTYQFLLTLIKIHVRRAAAEDILKFTCICVCVCIYLFVCVTSPGHTNNDTDLKFGTHTPIDLI